MVGSPSSGRESSEYDVVVVGAGSAGLCSAISARRHDARVLVLEKAPPEEQGGNCSYAGGGLRFVHNGVADIAPLLAAKGEDPYPALEPYIAEDYRYDLLKASQGQVDPDLMEMVVEKSYATMRWLTSLGVVWEQRMYQAPVTYAYLPGTVSVGATGGGEGLLGMLTSAAKAAGVEIAYCAKMLRLCLGPANRISAVTVAREDQVYDISTHAVVLACGGFEANQEMRIRYLGPVWEGVQVRGSRHNTGDGLRAVLDLGAATTGRLTGCHAVPVGASTLPVGTPESAAGVSRRSYNLRSHHLRSYHLGIMVNVEGKRFTDEGQGIGDLHFRQAAAVILSQPQRMAFQIFDTKATPHLSTRYASSKRISAHTIGELAQRLGIPVPALEETVREFNNACDYPEHFDPLAPDEHCTRDLTPPKSNWAIPLDSPPFAAYRVTGGITYTYGGLKVDRNARVLNTEDVPIGGLYAAGVIVGGFFHHESLRGSGLMLGAVLGRIAGEHAATSARVT
ncbi:FAD-dependent tricarballylate dehydrogenase TcuA [Chloroflexota bacterium]